MDAVIKPVFVAERRFGEGQMRGGDQSRYEITLNVWGGQLRPSFDETAGFEGKTCPQTGSEQVSANNMEEFKKMLEEKEPELYTRVYDEKGNQRKFVNIYLNDKNIKYIDKYEITDNDRLTLITAVAGG